MEKRMVAGLVLAAGLTRDASAQVQKEWPIHDETRPQPKVVDPGTAGTQARPGTPPSDAVVLFDGKDLSKWRTVKDGTAAKWKVADGAMQVVKGAGDIQTADGYGDAQIHVEWAAPSPAAGEGQHRGNSGVFPMGFYEIQVLDSYQSKTYPDGQAGALYGQYPPLVNASRPPGQWQTYDIVFRGPRFDSSGKVLRPARVTVLHNGVLVQDNRELSGPTAHKARPPYAAHPEKLPLKLQDHGDPVRYRNIWIRELGDE
jgi:3-keto-disaccharide hydrolase